MKNNVKVLIFFSIENELERNLRNATQIELKNEAKLIDT